MSRSESRRPRRTIADASERIERLAYQSAVVIFSISTCCMCHAVKRLFCSLGVSPAVHEIDYDSDRKRMEKVLMGLLGSSTALPVVFIGGKLIGSMDCVMAACTHQWQPRPNAQRRWRALSLRWPTSESNRDLFAKC